MAVGNSGLTPPSAEPAPLPRGALGRWLAGGGGLDARRREQTHRWSLVMWLTGVDYFSSLAYAPGIALMAAGALAPSATLILVAVTLLGALPVYVEVARRSYAGQGSIALLEHLLSGWAAKIFVLVLLGFAATDFVITMTLSAADAARHAVEDPYLQASLGGAHLGLTLGLLGLLAAIFLAGFTEAIEVATLVAVPFLLLNVVVLGAGLAQIAVDPSLLAHWRLGLGRYHDWSGLWIASALVFPQLALGLSGFETGVSVMPLIAGGRADEGRSVPLGRIRATRRLLVAAAVIMSAFLLASSFVTTMLIPESAYRAGGPAAGRAIAYLAHRLLGNVFGAAYDVSTIAILWFAGASALAGLINLIPRYLPRFGMAPQWVAYRRPMVLVLLAVDVLVTLAFRASVEAQGNAYATGVLALILSAALAASVVLWKEFRADPRHRPLALLLSLGFWGVTGVFAFTFVRNIFERPDGVIISMVFILIMLLFGAVSRYRRAQELRVSELSFMDDASKTLWAGMIGQRVNLVPHPKDDPDARARKAAAILARYRVQGPFAFLHVGLMDNRSEFMAPLRVRVTREQENFVIEVWGAVAIANTIAFISAALDPASVFLTLTRRNLMAQSFRYLLWGEGEVGLAVYTILVRYWESTHAGGAHPALYLMAASG